MINKFLLYTMSVCLIFFEASCSGDSRARQTIVQSLHVNLVAGEVPIELAGLLKDDPKLLTVKQFQDLDAMMRWKRTVSGSGLVDVVPHSSYLGLDIRYPDHAQGDRKVRFDLNVKRDSSLSANIELIWGGAVDRDKEYAKVKPGVCRFEIDYGEHLRFVVPLDFSDKGNPLELDTPLIFVLVDILYADRNIDPYSS